MRTGPLDFIILGIVALAIHWPTWTWLVAFGVSILLAATWTPPKR